MMDFTLSSELKMLRDTVRKFVEKELIPLETLVPEGPDIPTNLKEELEAKAKEAGLWMLDVPEEFGGAGLNEVEMTIVNEEVLRTSLLPYRSGGVFGPSPGPILLHALDDEQKDKYLWPVLKGEKRTAFALTEPDAGSDPARMSTNAVLDGNHYVINGIKRFITNADKADFLQVFAVSDKEKGARGGISCFLIDCDTPGFKITKQENLMIVEKPCEIQLEDCRVHKSQLVGKEGEGFKIAQKWLGNGRLRHGAKAVGTAMRALDLAKEYSQVRVTFGKPLSERQGIQWMLAQSALEIYQARLMCFNAAWKADQGYDIRVDASMVKYFAEEMAFRVLDRVMQIFGGMGLSKELPIEQMFRCVRSRRITEGASEIQLNQIARYFLKGEFPDPLVFESF